MNEISTHFVLNSSVGNPLAVLEERTGDGRCGITGAPDMHNDSWTASKTVKKLEEDQNHHNNQIQMLPPTSTTLAVLIYGDLDLLINYIHILSINHLHKYWRNVLNGLSWERAVLHESL